MKRNLTILSSLLVIGFSAVIVSCKKPDVNIKNETKDISKIENPLNDSNNRDTSNGKTKNNNIQGGGPSKEESISKKEKEEKTSRFASEIKNKVNDAITKNDKDEITKIADSIITKHAQLSTSFRLSKISSEFNNKIKNWLNSQSIDSILPEFLLFFNENISGKYVSKNINKYKDITKEKDKNTIVAKLQDLFNQTLGEEIEQESSKYKNEIDNLIKQQKNDKVKEKIFDLIDKIVKLEKTSSK
uniref:Lipoprotein n=1 Tax=Mycoplasma feriruminatoris TaxID=1179777 RepID=A0A654IP09_9MOLU|nr:hypothetical protein MF5582_00534 [Mycoplasma feriruminatoris]